MALIKCNECGKQISDQAGICPHCGYSEQAYTYCKVCGAKTKDGNFCSNCGYSNNTDYNAVNNQKPMCGIALAGGITGICSLFLDPLFATSIVAVILSSIGLNKVENGVKGKGWAITGLVCGIVEIVFKAIMLIVYYG